MSSPKRHAITIPLTDNKLSGWAWHKLISQQLQQQIDSIGRQQQWISNVSV